MLPQTQEAVREVRDDIAAVEVQDARAKAGLALQGPQPPLLQLGVEAVEVDVARQLRRAVQGAEAALLPQAAELFLCRKGQRRVVPSSLSSPSTCGPGHA